MNPGDLKSKLGQLSERYITEDEEPKETVPAPVQGQVVSIPVRITERACHLSTSKKDAIELLLKAGDGNCFAIVGLGGEAATSSRHEDVRATGERMADCYNLFIGIDDPLAAMEEVRKALLKIKPYAECNCAPDPDGVVRYHSNCARHLKPVVENAIKALTPRLPKL